MNSARPARNLKAFRELVHAAESHLPPAGLLAFSSDDLAEPITEQHRRVARDLVGSPTSPRTERVAALLSKLTR